MASNSSRAPEAPARTKTVARQRPPSPSRSKSAPPRASSSSPGNQTVAESAKCRGRTEGGAVCTRNTLVTHPYCWQHEIKEENLRVKPSAISGAGKGLFAQDKIRPKPEDNSKIVFHKGDKIAAYGGEILNKAELDRRYPGDTMAQYVLQVNKNKYIDARNTKAGVARYANDPRGSGKTANAKLKAAPAADKGKLEASRNIHENEEILTSYGPEYWGGRGKKAIANSKK